MALETLQSKTIAILGYGNQGRAHALNLRDEGLRVRVGARPEGKGWAKAVADGFEPTDVPAAATRADVWMCLMPDHETEVVVHALVAEAPGEPRWVGFAHGFAYQYGDLPQASGVEYFLAAPKGAGTVLRTRYINGSGLPTAWAVAPGSSSVTRQIAREYATAIAGRTGFVRETRFDWETEGDLFAEQAVLVGGVMELMQAAFETLVENGHPPELAFFDACQELKATLDLFLQHGPGEWLEHISPTARYGALTRGQRVVPPETKERMRGIYEEIRSGAFAAELREALSQEGKHSPGRKLLKQRQSTLLASAWHQAYLAVKDSL